jgi:Eco57I restriction endonuclease.
MNLKKNYNRDDFLLFLKSFIPNFSKDIRRAAYDGLQVTQEVFYLGESSELNLSIFEITHSSSGDARVALAMDGFKIMKRSATYRALVIYRTKRGEDWRLSLMTATPGINQKGKVSQVFSNPRRFSFFLGPNAKINTPYQFLIKQDGVKDFTELQKRFSLEVVNKEFYKQISENFTKLVGGTLGSGKNKRIYKPILRLPSVPDQSQISLEFAVRLIGRIIFCWFLREKKSPTGVTLMPRELLSLEAVDQHPDYYHQILESIFFEVLNKESRSRGESYSNSFFSLIPYLNGGLFSPHEDDYYKRRNGEQSLYHNTLVIPDEWFSDFFRTLEIYNFTIDENTSFDEELSIDPEMLGRIFENLLAEINPETGESARKCTGSYYTPRAIVDYMIDESLFLYLNEQTNIEDEILRALISYDLADDSQHPLNPGEKQKVIDALEKLKLLDPACGSGAFPIGALQKIVFILQQIDRDGQLWFKTQIKKASPEIRRVIEREFSHKNFDYIRKLGVIRENIYGVDIQPIATEISRLRCFLTLVVDERVDDSLTNRGIEPLPNLDFKFVTANSLIDLPSNHQSTLFNDQDGIDQLKDLRNQFFNATNSERYQLKDEFKEIQKRMLMRIIETRGSDEITKMLSAWDPFNNKASSWFDPEWMFGINSGFDIVIANPPYGAKFTDNEKQYLKTTYNHQDYQPESFLFFTEKGLNVLKNNAVLSFIIPNTWLTNLKLVKIRKFLTGSNSIVNISHYHKNVFDAVVDTEVVIIKKGFKANNIVRVFNHKDANHVEVLKHNQNNWKEKNGDVINIFTNERIEKLVEKLKINSEVLSFYCDLYSGVKPYEIGKGIPHQTKEMLRNRVYDSTKKIDNSYVKVIRGSDISKFQNNWDGKRWIKYGDNLAAKRKPEIFSNPKIIIRQTGDSLIATYDEKGFICLNNTHVINQKLNIDLKYILALINCSLLNFYFQYLNPEAGEALAEVKKETVEKLLIKKPRDQKPFITLVDKILLDKEENPEADTSQLEKKLDTMIYNLYDLNQEEIEIVENSNKK